MNSICTQCLTDVILVRTVFIHFIPVLNYNESPFFCLLPKVHCDRCHHYHHCHHHNHHCYHHHQHHHHCHHHHHHHHYHHHHHHIIIMMIIIIVDIVIVVNIIIVLSCDVWLDPVFEVKYPCFPTTFQAVGHMIVWYQWQRHLLIVMSHSCLDNITYPLSHNTLLITMGVYFDVMGQ